MAIQQVSSAQLATLARIAAGSPAEAETKLPATDDKSSPTAGVGELEMEDYRWAKHQLACFQSRMCVPTRLQSALGQQSAVSTESELGQAAGFSRARYRPSWAAEPV